MKKLLTLLVVLMWVTGAKADNLGPLTTAQFVQCEVFSMDSAGVDPIAAESLFIVVYDVDGDSTFGEIIDTSNVSVKGPYTRRTGNGATIIFYNWVRAVSAIDGDQGVGPYQISVIAYEDADETRWITHHNFYLINSPLHALLDSAGLAAVAAQLALDSLRAQDGWVAQQTEVANIDGFNFATDSVTAKANVASMDGGVMTVGVYATGAITADAIAPNAITNSELATDAIGAAEFAADAVNEIWEADTSTINAGVGEMLKDTSAYQGSASSLDSAIISRINHRVVWGTPQGSGSDSSTAAQRDIGAIAQAVIDAIWDEDSTGHWTSPNMAFIAGQTSASALDSAIMSNILHRIVWGTAVGSGSDSSTSAQRDIGILAATVLALISDSVWDEILTGATHNIASSAGRRLRQLETGQVLLTGTINTANDSTATLGLSGNYPDDFFLHNWLVVTVGTDSVQIRQINGYTGATDSVDMAAAESWVINPVNGDAWEIIANTGVHVVDLHPPVVLQIIAAMYDKGIWIDDGSGNTNTEPGVDGTIANPVSTFAAARTIADALGYQKYYLVNNTSLTLAATHEDWDFIGVGESNEINFGGQDVDNSHFEHLMVAGIQGGTGLIWLDECYMDAADSLECVARNSWFSDTVSVRVASNIIFDNCFSAVAGNNTPGLDFNSAAGAINVNVRHYSGGLALFNGTSNHTISYETDGQLVIDASCTSINVTARGNMTITDNGTTTALTDFAVFNVNAVAAYPEYTYKMVATGSPTTQTIAVSYIVDNEGNSPGTAANDFCLGMEFQPKGGNSNSKMQTIADFTIADSTFTVRPGFASAPNSGDTIFIRPGRGGVEPSTWTQHELAITATGEAGIDLDNTVGDYAADDFESAFYEAIADSVLKDSLSYQGAAAGLTAKEVIDSLSEAYFDTVYALADFDSVYWARIAIYSDSGSVGAGAWSVAEKDSAMAALFDYGTAVSGGAMTFLTRMILGFPSASPGWDTLTNSVTSMIGTYTGNAGVGGNIKDAIEAFNGGSGAFSCSLFAYNSGWIPNGGSPAITSGTVRMISGANDYRLRINPDGWVVFSLDGGTWTAYITALRFLQDTIPNTFTFSADYTDTLTMTAFTPSSPSDTGKVVLYVYTDSTLGGKFDGATFRVIPVARGKSWVSGGNRILPLGELTKTTNSTGYAEIEVYQSSFTHPYPSGSDSLKYNISITYPGLTSWGQFNFVAPDSGDQYQIGVIE